MIRVMDAGICLFPGECQLINSFSTAIHRSFTAKTSKIRVGRLKPAPVKAFG